MTQGSVGLKLTRPEGTLRDGALIRTFPSLYTPSQISQYLLCIGFPQDETFSPSIENLERLLRLHIIAFPFETTEMHYTPGHQMDVTPEGLFQRLVVERRGSYCFGHGTIVLQVLRGLGYRAYAGSARVNLAMGQPSGPLLGPQGHMVLFVQPNTLESNQNARTYIADVWFGGQGMVRPILLSDKDNNVVMGASPYEWHRLKRRPHLRSSLESTMASAEQLDFHWAMEYQRRNDTVDISAPWQLCYLFTENECFPEDIEDSSFLICNKPEGILRNNILAVRYFTFDQLDQEGLIEAAEQFARYPKEEWKNILWKRIAFRNRVKRLVGGSAVTIRTPDDEAARIQALNELFALNLPDDSYRHVMGRPPLLDRY